MLDACLAELHGTASAAILPAEHKIIKQAENDNQYKIRNDACPPWHFRHGPVIIFDNAIPFLFPDGFSQIIEKQIYAWQIIFQLGLVLQSSTQGITINHKFCDLLLLKGIHNLRIGNGSGTTLLHQYGYGNHQKDDDNGVKAKAFHFVAIVVCLFVQKCMSLLSAVRKCYSPPYTDGLSTPTYGRLRYLWS